MASRQEIINALKGYKLRYAAQYGIETLGLFGSFARGEQRETSDVDVCVRLKRKSFFTRMKIKEELERLFGLPVDVASLDAMMLPQFKSALQHDTIYV